MIARLMYVYAFLLPILDKYSGDRSFFLLYILGLAALGVIAAMNGFSFRKAVLSKYFILFAAIIGFGVIGALLHFENFFYLRYSLSMIFLFAIMLLVHQFLSHEQVTNMFLFYGVGLLVGTILGGTGEGRLSGDIVNAQNVYIMPPIIIAICFMKMILANSKFYKCVLLCLGSFLIYLSSLSQLRINLILLCLVGIYFAVVYRYRFGHYKLIISIPLIIIILTGIRFYYQTQYRAEGLLSMLQSPGNVLDKPSSEAFSIQTRVVLANAGINIFLNNPLGVGFGNFPHFAAPYVPFGYPIGHPHNTFIEILVSTGLGGAIFSIFLILYLFKKLEGNSFMKLILIMLLVAGLTDTLIYDKMLLLLFVSRDILSPNGIEK